MIRGCSLSWQHPLFHWNCMSAFLTAGACVGTATTIEFGKQIRIVCLPGRGVYQNWKQCRSRPSPDCSAWVFAVANCPLRTPLNCVFLTVGNTTGKISLVQITATSFGLGGFLYDTFEIIIVWTCFSRRFRTFLGPRGRKFLLLSYRFCATDCYVKVHIYAVAIVEKDNSRFLLVDNITNTKAAGAQLHQRPCV